MTLPFKYITPVPIWVSIRSVPCMLTHVDSYGQLITTFSGWQSCTWHPFRKSCQNWHQHSSNTSYKEYWFKPCIRAVHCSPYCCKFVIQWILTNWVYNWTFFLLGGTICGLLTIIKGATTQLVIQTHSIGKRFIELANSNVVGEMCKNDKLHIL